MDDSKLSTDHVNYLVWRYLQEQGHGEAAVKFQHSWLPKSNPQSLHFSQFVNRRALVSLVHKGLRYNQIEQIRLRDNHDAAEIPPVTLFFGKDSRIDGPRRGIIRNRTSNQTRQNRTRDSSEIRQAVSKSRNNDTHEEHDRNATTPPTQGTRLGHKRMRRNRDSNTTSPDFQEDAMQVDTGTGNDTWADEQHDDKSRRQPNLVNGTNIDSKEDDENLMDVDGVDRDLTNEHKDGLSQEQVIPTLADGRSIGIQSVAVIDSTLQSTILSTDDKDNIMYLRWASPSHGSTILAAGGDAFCRLWTTPVSPIEKPLHTSSDGRLQSTALQNTSGNINLHNASDRGLVTAMSWNSDSSLLAVATRSASTSWLGAVSTWTSTGRAVDDLIAGQDLVIQLRWSPHGRYLLGITVQNSGQGALVVWDMQSLGQSYLPLINPSGQGVKELLIADAVWTGPSSFWFCGRGAVGYCTHIDRAFAHSSSTKLSPPLSSTITVQNAPSLEWLNQDDEQIISASWAYIRASSSGHLVVADAEHAKLAFISYQPRSGPGFNLDESQKNPQINVKDDPNGLPLSGSRTNFYILIDVHADALTALEVYVSPSSTSKPSISPTTIAVTSSLDGSIKLWNADSRQLMQTLRFDLQTGPLAVSIRPYKSDNLSSTEHGYLAAANFQSVYIWKISADHEESQPAEAARGNTATSFSTLIGAWHGDLGTKISSPNVEDNVSTADRDSGFGDEDDLMKEPHCSLSWSGDGDTLALAGGNQIALVDTRNLS